MLSLLALTPAAAGESADFSEPAAVVVHFTESDLNRIVQDIFFANGGPVFSGYKPVVSRSISELDYAARLSLPRLRLHDDALATLRFEIEDAEVHIGSIERRIIGRQARCEDIEILLDPDRRLGVTMEMQFLVADRALQLAPQTVEMPGASRAFRLPRPSRCHNTPLPKRLLWWLGRPSLRRQLGRLDDKLLQNMQRSTEHWERSDGWSDGSWSRFLPGPALEPRTVDTVDGGLRITLGAGEAASATPDPLPLAAPGRSSFVAVAENLLNAILAAAFEERSERSSRPGGDLAELFRSDAILTLVPGLRALESQQGLWLNYRFLAPPRLTFSSTPGDAPALEELPRRERPLPERAVITVELGGIEMQIHREQRGRDELLGALAIDHGKIAVVPYRSRIGGISFLVLQNEWHTSSKGLAFDEPLLAATLQELVFGELFETSYNPLALDGFALGETRFRVRGFLSRAGYLFVELDADPAELAPQSASAVRNAETSSLAR